MGSLQQIPNQAGLLPPMMVTAECRAQLQLANKEVRELWAPTPDVSIVEWSEKNLTLRKGTSNRPGPFQAESYQRGLFEAIQDPETREFVLKKSTQIGFNAIINAVIGYYIDADPGPILFTQGSDGDVEDYSKKRLAPLIEDCPALKAKVHMATSRKAGNTLTLKEFDGGFLRLAGTKSAKGLRSDPIRILIMDEVDGYDLDVEGEGDPCSIAARRTDTYEDAKIIKGSTPAKPKKLSRIQQDFERGSMEHFHVPCPFCGHMQPLIWRDESGVYRLVWKKDPATGKPIQGTVRYICRACEEGIDEKYKQRMLNGGKWIAMHPERRKVRSFSINALYAPWKSDVWDELAEEWHEAQDNPEKLKSFINLRLGECWNEGSEQQWDSKKLRLRCEAYAPLAEQGEGLAPRPAFDVPAAGAVLVAAADVQDNRVELQWMAFGSGEESWLIGHEIVWGNPQEKQVWEQVDAQLLREWKHELGGAMLPSICLIDSGDGGNVDAVYDFVLHRQFTARRIFASKGVRYHSRPILVAEGTTKRAHIRLFTVATDTAKDRIFKRLEIAKPGPGYHHLPDWVTDEYLAQLVSEQKITIRDKRTRGLRREYVKVHTRNEALDLTVYCHAGLFILQNYIDGATYRDLGKLVEKLRTGHKPMSLVQQRRRRVRSRGIQ